MTVVTMISEENAPPQVHELYNRVKTALGLPKVPNIFRAMAHTPAFLADMIENHIAVMGAGTLDKTTKEMIALAVSAANGCNYCTAVHAVVGRQAGLAEAQVAEVLALAAIMSGHNHFQKFKDNAGDDDTYKPLRFELAESLSRQKTISTLQAELIYICVSTVNSCHTCVRFHVSKAKAAGAKPEQIKEALSVMNLLIMYNNFVKTLNLPIDI